MAQEVNPLPVALASRIEALIRVLVALRMIQLPAMFLGKAVGGGPST